LEIERGIHTIPRVRGANAYLVKSDEGFTVIDTGLPGNAGRIVDYVESIGCPRSDVKTIVITHPDIDHAGSAGQLKQRTDARVAIHEADAPRLSGEKEWKTVSGVLGVFFLVTSPVMRFNRVKADVLLNDSDIVNGLTVIHAPGHTEGSICLYLPGRAIFVGDALVTDDEGMPSLPRRSMSMDMNLAKESVRKISRLDYSLLLPGHGLPIRQNASTVMKEFVARF
jgi:glyoxylase-like metal-dependent hydrolase (beta-lactamase superfamily II)